MGRLRALCMAKRASVRNAPGAASRRRWPIIRRRMIDRAEVLHVARLARLKLTDEEVDRMAAELSSILGHIDTITQLDLDDVEPTSHIVTVDNPLREDIPGPCLPHEVALDQAPATQDGGFLVPSPQAS